MRIFDTNVQKLKYMVLREVARHAYADRLRDCYLDIPKTIAPGPKPTMRCCVYKERAIAAERVKLAMGGDRSNPNVVEVIPIACDECPVSAYKVGESCRGCIAHRCESTCPRGAISFDDDHVAHIDPKLCVECGKCAAVCPYAAIQRHVRPCENACKVKAISMGGDGIACINADKCIGCGACVYQCPFGAISDKSFLLDCINLLRESDGGARFKVYAVVAPSISSQFRYAKVGQVIAAMKLLGFSGVAEAALGADTVAYNEAKELSEKKTLISSCCPVFVRYVQKSFPALLPCMSSSPSPMTATATLIKSSDPNAKVVFVGPCTAKKLEAQLPEVRQLVDCVLTFEELQALIDSRDFDISCLPEEELDDDCRFGRALARAGGLSDAVRLALKAQNSDLTIKPVVCDSVQTCRAALLKLSRGALTENFVEGMMCQGGCVGGAGCLTHG